MTNLPITSSIPKSSGNTANAAQTNSTADSQATEWPLRSGVANSAQPSAGGGLSTFGVSLADAAGHFADMLARQIGEVDPSSTADSQATEWPLRSGAANSAQPSAGGGLSTFGVSLADAAGHFADMLARQIGEADPSSTNVAPGAITIYGAVPSLKNEQDQAAITTSTPGDQAGTLVAMLLQLPQEMRTPVANDAASTSTATINATGIGGSARKSVSRTDAKLDVENTALCKTDATAIAANKQIIIDVVNQNAVKRAELAAILTQPGPNTTQAAILTQPGPNTTQSVASPAISALMPDMLVNNKLSDTTQSIPTPLGSNGWADDFSQKITWMSTQKNQVAELRLNPPDLGPLNVVLKISDNQATALFTSPHSAVREAVENAMPKLREILADNGIMLGNTTVSDQSSRDRSADGFMNQGSGMAAQSGDSSDSSELTGASPATAQVVPARRHNGMVDTFA